VDRTAFLDRVRAELGPGASREPALPTGFPRTPASGDGGPPVERFLASLEQAAAKGRSVTTAELAGAVAGVVQVDQRVILAPDIEPWRAEIEEGVRRAGAVVTDAGPETTGWRDVSVTADWGVTSGVLGVAATGSVLVVPGDRSPRVVSLLPESHLVVLPASAIVPGLEEAMAAVARSNDQASSAVLITGPSRTTDIELITVFGVHGPRRVHVLVVADA
jgi:L-lactate dehydrogenase complex protein LldG